MLGIEMIVGPIPGVAMLLGALILVWRPLRGGRLRALQQQAPEVHAHKHAQLEGSD